MAVGFGSGVGVSLLWQCWYDGGGGFGLIALWRSLVFFLFGFMAVEHGLWPRTVRPLARIQHGALCSQLYMDDPSPTPANITRYYDD